MMLIGRSYRSGFGQTPGCTLASPCADYRTIGGGDDYNADYRTEGGGDDYRESQYETVPTMHSQNV